MTAGGTTALERKLRSLPKSPGVYLFHDESGKVIYVGKARILRNRVRQYFQQSSDGRYQYDLLVRRIADVEVITTDTELEALILEINLIREHKPRYNIDLKDDKSFPYLRITNEAFPRVFLTRHPVLDGSRYFGPYSDLFHLKGLLRVLRSMLKIRTCNLALTEEGVARGRFKVCLEFHIGRCNAPCIGHESREEYARRVEDFADVAQGKATDVIQRLHEELEHLSDALRFEQAAQLRDWLSALDNLTQRQKMISPEPVNRDIFGLAIEDDLGCAVVLQVRGGRMLGRLHYRLRHVADREPADILADVLQRFYAEPVSMPHEVFLPVRPSEGDVIEEWLLDRTGSRVRLHVPARGERAKLVELAHRNAELLLAEFKMAREARQRVPAAIPELQRQLRLPKLPLQIAGFDVSSLRGSDKVASMVVFENGRPTKSQYRRFRIRGVEGSDDYACMKEVVARRFARLKRDGEPMPDLALVDGGKGQLAAALSAFSDLKISAVPVIGLAKKLEEVFVAGDEMPHYLPRTSSALKLLQQIRDEAHRFAVTYHRRLRDRRSLQSVLEEIEGVGPARRRALFAHFSTVKAIRAAGLDELRQVKGIPHGVAERIFHFFRNHMAASDE